MLAFLAQIATGIMDEAGALQTWKPDNFERRAGVHLLGTCRMGDEPNTSAVDKFHRTHGVPNLFLCDGSKLGNGRPGSAHLHDPGAGVPSGTSTPSSPWGWVVALHAIVARYRR